MAKKAKKIGRPTKYKPEYCDKLIEFFDIPFYKTIEVEKMSASGAVKTLTVQVANDFPLLEDFCWELGIAPNTIQNWAKEYPDFLRAVNIAKGRQKQFLVKHGLTGAYTPRTSALMLVNVSDIVDKSEVKTENDHNVKGYGLAFDLSQKPEDL